MVKTSSSEKRPLKKGAWSSEEDQKLVAYIKRYKIWNWREMSKAAGLTRSGKSCRLRWMNYLRPDIKHGDFSKEEEETIMTLHETLGNRWSAIAAKLPGRTDNEVKNYWHTHLKKRLMVDVSTSTVLAESHKAADETSAKNLIPDSDLPSPKPAESTPKLEGSDNTVVVSRQPPPSTDNLSSVITLTAPTSCEIGKEGNVVESIIDNTFSEPLNIEDFQSLWTKPDVVSNGDLFSLHDQFVGPSSDSQVWQQDPIWPCDFYEEYDCYDWVDYLDEIFKN